ncbi:unnamed protein product, partial [Ectocarpus sp. 13 AM-2016]
VDGAGSLGEREVRGAGRRVQLRHRVLGAAVASLSLRWDESDSGGSCGPERKPATQHARMVPSRVCGSYRGM